MGGRSSYKIRTCRFCSIETDSTNICFPCYSKGLRLKDLKKKCYNLDMKTIKCPICKKEPAWVAWGHITPCLSCQPAKLIIKSQG